MPSNTCLNTYPRFLLAGLSILILASVATAQIPPDEVLKDFKVNGDFQFEQGGKTLQDAELLFSERAVAYLVLTPELSSPLLINLRSRAIESLEAEKIIRDDDGTAHILADAMLTPAGTFSLQGKQVVFTVDGKESRLKSRPWLTGKHGGATLKKHNPEYAYKAGQYISGEGEIAALKNHDQEVRVRIYFGSWCPHCKQMVPRVLRVEDELEGSQIQFEYYGLGRPLGQDPVARKEKVHSVPMAVVYVGGEEVRRLEGQTLSAPEKILLEVLNPKEEAGS